MDLDSGDLLLFDGFSGLSKIIKFFTRGSFSHAGIVWKCPVSGILYVWENGDPNKNEYPIIHRSGSQHSSAHLIPLSVKLKHYNGGIFVRRLITNDSLVFTQKLTEFILENIGKPYRYDFVACWNQKEGGSLLHLPFMEDHDSDSNSWVCSELVLKTYVHTGVMDLVRGHAHSVMPDDLAEVEHSRKIDVKDGFALLELEYVEKLVY